MPALCSSRWPRANSSGALLRGSCARNAEVERGAATELALDPERAAVLLHQRARDGEPEAGATVVALVLSVRLLVALEHGLQLVASDADALVLDREQAARVLGLDPHRHLAAPAGELERVSDQVDQHLP